MSTIEERIRRNGNYSTIRIHQRTYDLLHDLADEEGRSLVETVHQALSVRASTPPAARPFVRSGNVRDRRAS